MSGRNSTQHGFTMIEVLVVATLLVVVFTAISIVYSGGRRMNQAAQLTVAVHSALRIQEQLSVDLKAMAVRPSPLAPYRIGASGTQLALYRASFEGPAIKLTPIRYRLEPTPSGNGTLVREEFTNNAVTSSRSFGSVIIKDLKFEQVFGRNGEGRYIIVTLTTLNEDYRPEELVRNASTKTFSLLFLNKVPITAAPGSPILGRSQGYQALGGLPSVS